MKKSQLVARVSRRALSRYEQYFDESLLNDLIKDGLIPTSVRLYNNGLSPHYGFDRCAYRRALQILRLKSHGITSRNSQRIVLFLKGYSQEIYVTKRALRNEYVKSSKNILSAIRSIYADNNKDIPQQHKRSLIRRMGKPNAHLVAAGFVYSDHINIRSLRAAKQELICEDCLSLLSRLRGHVCTAKHILTKRFINALLKLISGLLMFRVDKTEPLTDIEKLILESDEKYYIAAREYYRNSKHIFDKAARVLSPFTSSANHEAGVRLILLSAKHDARWACLIFVLCLRMSRFMESFQDLADRIRLKQR